MSEFISNFSEICEFSCESWRNIVRYRTRYFNASYIIYMHTLYMIHFACMHDMYIRVIHICIGNSMVSGVSFEFFRIPENIVQINWSIHDTIRSPRNKLTHGINCQKSCHFALTLSNHVTSCYYFSCYYFLYLLNIDMSQPEEQLRNEVQNTPYVWV